MRLLILALSLSFSLAAADTVADVLARLDLTASSFQSLSARVKRTDYTAVLKDTSTSTGSVLLRRSGGRIVGLIEFHEPDPRFIELRDRKVTVYYPKANTAEIYEAGKRADQLDQFIVLGFGSSAADLKKNYEIKLAGSEVLGGVKTSRLELIPRSGEAREQLLKIELWVPEDGAHAIQEKLYQKSNDWNLIVYTDVKLNPSLPESAFQLKMPGNVRRINANK